MGIWMYDLHVLRFEGKVTCTNVVLLGLMFIMYVLNTFAIVFVQHN